MSTHPKRPIQEQTSTKPILECNPPAGWVRSDSRVCRGFKRWINENSQEYVEAKD